MRRLAVLLGCLAILLGVRRSRAGDLTITTLDGTPWGRLVQQIQDDIATQGRVYPIVVRDDRTKVSCDEYELSLDVAAAMAFSVGACDPVTGATALRLDHREALFEPGEIVPRARTAVIRATIARHGSARGGGAPPQAGSKLWCSVALQPYLWDGLRGQPVPLMPDRFALRPIETHIQASPDGAGWIARGESRFALRFHYEVVDLRTKSRVLENEASLLCADAPADRPPVVLPPAPSCAACDEARTTSSPLDLPPGRGAPPWWVAIDLPTPPTFVATMLIRPLDDVVLPGGQHASKLYVPGAPLVLGGSTFGISAQRGMLFFPARLTVAGDNVTLGISGFTGLGLGLGVGPDVSVYAAPTVRFTALQFGDLGWFNRWDGAALLGIRRRVWGSPSCRGHGGFEVFAEMAAPLASSGVWFVSGGVTQSWGPGGGYYYTGCPEDSEPAEGEAVDARSHAVNAKRAGSPGTGRARSPAP